MVADETRIRGMQIHMAMVGVCYCPDTNHDVKLQAKEQQHAQILAILEGAGHKGRHHTITLVTTEAARKEMLDTLQQLGVALPQATSNTGITHERFASPLGHSPIIPTYCSEFEQDQPFGAQWDA